MDQDDAQQRAIDAYMKNMGRSLPKVKHKKKTMKKPQKASPVEERPDWNGRFFVESIPNFTKIHNHYKVRLVLLIPLAIFRQPE
jgi:hypothetical protein